VTERQATRRRAASSRAWSYIAGEKGKNRVRVYERGSFGLWIDYRDVHGKRVRQPLGHGDRERAKLKADEVAAKFRRHGAAPAALTLRTLFDIYEREVTPHKAASTQAHDRRTLPLFLKAFGSNRLPETLNRRDWDSYIARRRSGKLAPKHAEGGTVRDRVIEQDLKLLLAVLNWAERAGSGQRGGYLLDRNPLKGLEIPKELSPRRPRLTDEQFTKVREAGASMTKRAELFVVLAWYTGHRSASIRHLRWSDVDLEGARIHWRGESDKIGYDHWNPLHPICVELLKTERQRVAAIGDAWVFNVKKGKPLSRAGARSLWRRIAEKAEIPDREGHGWHSCRRSFANRMRHASLRDLKDLGGWKTEQTVVSVYQQPSESAQREALLAADSPPTGTTNGHKPETSQKEVPASA
jgi:integrase